MTKNDKLLLKKAENAGRFDWQYLFNLSEKADSEEVRKTIKDMGWDAFKSEEIYEFDL